MVDIDLTPVPVGPGYFCTRAEANRFLVAGGWTEGMKDYWSKGPRQRARVQVETGKGFYIEFRSIPSEHEFIMGRASAFVLGPWPCGEGVGVSLHLDVPTTFPDGSGKLTAEEWVEWAKRELLYGTHPLPK